MRTYERPPSPALSGTDRDVEMSALDGRDSGRRRVTRYSPLLQAAAAAAAAAIPGNDNIDASPDGRNAPSPDPALVGAVLDRLVTMFQPPPVSETARVSRGRFLLAQCTPVLCLVLVCLALFIYMFAKYDDLGAAVSVGVKALLMEHEQQLLDYNAVVVSNDSSSSFSATP